MLHTIHLSYNLYGFMAQTMNKFTKYEKHGAKKCFKYSTTANLNAIYLTSMSITLHDHYST